MKVNNAKKMKEIFEKNIEKIPDKSKYVYKELLDMFKFQIYTLKKLEKVIRKEGTVIEKEYVKGRPSITMNPAIAQHNATSKAMNTTVNTLVKMLDSIPEDVISSESKGTSGLLGKLVERADS